MNSLYPTGRRLAALLVLATVAAAAAARASPATLFHAEGAEDVDATPGRALLELTEVTRPALTSLSHNICLSIASRPPSSRQLCADALLVHHRRCYSFLHLRLSPSSTL